MARILALDDEPDVLTIVEAALEMAGHRVVCTSDPRQGVVLAIEHRVDVVVLDVTMPELSGLEVLAALRANPQSAGLPVLFLSALGDSKDRIRGLRHGADDYLAKPFEPEELVLRVEKLVALSHRAHGGTEPPLNLSSLLDGEAPAKDVYLGRYQVFEVIGKGAMGLVLRGWDPRLKRPVALKTIRRDRFLEVDLTNPLHELVTEATTLARFSHPNIVTIFDAGFSQDNGFIVMEYVDGVSLQHRLNLKFRLALKTTVELGIAIARALQAAHSANLVHRDVKPGNILLGNDGSIKVSDFGVADLARTLTSSKTHRVFGTPGFVPPESLRCLGYGAAGDIFGLGAIIYRCLMGFPAFGGKNVRQVLLNTLQEEALSPREVDPAIPVGLSTLLLQLLRKKPEDRPSAAETEEAFCQVAEELVPEAEQERQPLESLPGDHRDLMSARMIDTRVLEVTH
jgi:CheY-like chemotaxis protein